MQTSSSNQTSASPNTSTGIDAPALTIPTRDGYDRWADLYDTDGNPLIALEERITQPLLRDVAGLRICDVGCGTGRHAVALAQRGGFVTALDFSTGMLDQARAKPGAERVTWMQHDLTQPLPLTDQTFDLTLSALVFDHVRDPAALFAQMRRVTGSTGRVLMTVMHPAMMLRGVQARFHDPATNQRVQPASVPNQLCDYVMGAVDAGLRIESMSEHAVDDELIQKAPRAEKHRGWPLLAVMILRP